jgi:hypothetical protein
MHPIHTTDSTVKTTETTTKVDAAQVKTGPIELSLESLKQVGGGLAPRGTWAAAAVQAPRGTW